VHCKRSVATVAAVCVLGCFILFCFHVVARSLRPLALPPEPRVAGYSPLRPPSRPSGGAEAEDPPGQGTVPDLFWPCSHQSQPASERTCAGAMRDIITKKNQECSTCTRATRVSACAVCTCVDLKIHGNACDRRLMWLLIYSMWTDLAICCCTVSHQRRAQFTEQTY
jgi:hypothetical protein